jgi:hypothetical protein
MFVRIFYEEVKLEANLYVSVKLQQYSLVFACPTWGFIK